MKMRIACTTDPATAYRASPNAVAGSRWYQTSVYAAARPNVSSSPQRTAGSDTSAAVASRNSALAIVAISVGRTRHRPASLTLGAQARLLVDPLTTGPGPGRGRNVTVILAADDIRRA